jgi:predicted phosphoribosyltransferase
MLAERLTGLPEGQDLVVAGILFGGVPVAYEISRALRALLFVIPVISINHPGHAYIPYGALAPGDVQVWDHDLIRKANLAESSLTALASRQRVELEKLQESFPMPQGKWSATTSTLVLVDDSLTTPVKFQAAYLASQDMNPGRVIAAAPVGTEEAIRSLEKIVDEVICPEIAQPGQRTDTVSDMESDAVVDTFGRAEISSEINYENYYEDDRDMQEDNIRSLLQAYERDQADKY